VTPEPGRWAATFVFGRTILSLFDSGIDDGARHAYEIYVNGHRRDPIYIQRHFIPSVGGYGDNRFAVWGGSVSVFGSVEPSNYRVLAHSEPILAIYRIRDGWCVVSELSVSLIDETCKAVSSEMHDEVIVSSSWHNGILCLEDFEKRHLFFEVDEEKMLLRIASGDVIRHRDQLDNQK